MKNAKLTQFKNYLSMIERDVIFPIAENGIKTERLVSTRPGKLYATNYGRMIELLLYSDEVFAVDYYGFHKKTVGFIRKSNLIRQKLGKKHVSIKVPVVSFAAIHVEDILKHAPELVANFHKFKSELIELRGFSLNEK